jgi:GNAT acetyltransferase-like protein
VHARGRDGGGARARDVVHPVSSLRFEIRPFRAGDEERVLAFHNRAFAGHAPRSRAHFDWRFLRNPGGPPELVLALDGERCVAVYAVLPVRAILRDAPVLAGLQTDMAVEPELRTGLGGSRLILAVGEAYQREFLNGSKTLEWGFPEPELQRVCIVHLKVGVLRDVCFLVRKAEHGFGLAPGGPRVERVTRFTDEVDELWARCASELGTATVRDARYLNWRYAEHPDVPHVLLEARESGALRGLAVLREGGPDPRLLSLMDWLVPAAERGAELALLAQSCAEARTRGLPFLAAWVPLALPLALRWQEELGFFAKSTPFQECYRCWAPGVGRRWLDEHWYQTLGDIDFF